MKVEGASALVTGANRGLGAAIAQALVDAGAKVYGAARDNTTITNQDVIPVLLDVNSPSDIADAARICGDVSIVVNNAGIGRSSTSLAADAVDAARAELETNFFGPMQVAQAFAPVLQNQNIGLIVDCRNRGAETRLSRPKAIITTVTRDHELILVHIVRNTNYRITRSGR